MRHFPPIECTIHEYKLWRNEIEVSRGFNLDGVYKCARCGQMVIFGKFDKNSRRFVVKRRNFIKHWLKELFTEDAPLFIFIIIVYILILVAIVKGN